MRNVKFIGTTMYVVYNIKIYSGSKCKTKAWF